MSLLLALHGLLHLLGFAKAFQLMPAGERSGPAEQPLPSNTRRRQRLAGVLWVAACAALVVAAVLLLVGVPRWWMVAAAALVLSQVLIFGAWSSARAGTVVNVLLAVPVVIAAAMSSFHDGTDAAARAVRTSVPADPAGVVTAADLAPLPAPVATWLQNAGVVGRPRVRSVRLWQRGALRTSADGAWMPAEARQDFTVDAPAFVWGVHVTMARIFPVVGRDSYVGGAGRMIIRLGGVIPLADAQGPKIDQGSMLRYLGEIVWFPSAALAPYLRWEQLGPEAAQATFTDGAHSVSAVFTFDASGRVLKVAAERYQGAGPDATLKRWEVPCQAWRRMADDILVPVEGRVVWKEANGDFETFRWEITRIETDARAAVLEPLAQGLRELR